MKALVIRGKSQLLLASSSLKCNLEIEVDISAQCHQSLTVYFFSVCMFGILTLGTERMLMRSFKYKLVSYSFN